MIQYYGWRTPNGLKIPIMLEEISADYHVHRVDISRGEQFAPEFLKLSPNNKIPAIVDEDAPGGPLSVFESGAILTYLAERSGRFLPATGPARVATFEWLHWQIGGLGPMLGQLGFFAVRSKDKVPLAIDRFTEEAERLLGVLERRLAESRYLAGDDYSIADIATYSWTAVTRIFLKGPLEKIVGASPATDRWLAEIGDRPAVRRGMATFDA